MKLYITVPSVLVLIVFYLPVVLWVLWRIWRSPRWRGAGKVGILTLALLLAYAIPLGDVTVNSMAMAKVCPNAGLHIYKTVEVGGYLTEISDGNVLKKHPYQYIEVPQLKADGTYNWLHYKAQSDRTIIYDQLAQPTAEYEVISVDWHLDRERSVESSAYVVRNRVTKEVLAEWNLFNPLPGWLDKTLVVRWFGAGGRNGCHGEPAYGFEYKVLIPKKSR